MTDGENLTNAEQVEVSGLIGYLTQKDDKYTLLWADERFIYTIQGKLPKEEILQMAKSVPTE